MSSRKKPKIGRWILLSLFYLYSAFTVDKSIQLNSALRPLEEKFVKIINQEDYTKEKNWNEAVNMPKTDINYEKGLINSLLDERDNFLGYNKGTKSVEWHIKQYKDNGKKYLVKNGVTVVFNPFAKINNYDQYLVSKNELETIAENN
jgi:hypothetical protein